MACLPAWLACRREMVPDEGADGKMSGLHCVLLQCSIASGSMDKKCMGKHGSEGWPADKSLGPQSKLRPANPVTATVAASCFCPNPIRDGECIGLLLQC